MSAARDDGRGYRETITEMRAELVEQVRWWLDARLNLVDRTAELAGLRADQKANCLHNARAVVRRIRALDHATFCMDELGRQLYLKFVAAQEREP